MKSPHCLIKIDHQCVRPVTCRVSLAWKLPFWQGVGAKSFSKKTTSHGDKVLKFQHLKKYQCKLGETKLSRLLLVKAQGWIERHDYDTTKIWRDRPEFNSFCIDTVNRYFNPSCNDGAAITNLLAWYIFCIKYFIVDIGINGRPSRLPPPGLFQLSKSATNCDRTQARS